MLYINKKSNLIRLFIFIYSHKKNILSFLLSILKFFKTLQSIIHAFLIKHHEVFSREDVINMFTPVQSQ
jgi:hypothetical protein